MNFNAISKNVKILQIGPVEPKLWKIREINVVWLEDHAGGKNHSHVERENLVRFTRGGKFQSLRCWQLVFQGKFSYYTEKNFQFELFKIAFINNQCDFLNSIEASELHKRISRCFYTKCYEQAIKGEGRNK